MLMDAQERQVFRRLNGKSSRQHGFGVWTRHIVGNLIMQRFGVTLSLASVGALLARAGVTSQKPRQRAYQRDPPNPVSRVFHDKFGFEELGAQWVAGDTKQVSLQVTQV